MTDLMRGPCPPEPPRAGNTRSRSAPTGGNETAGADCWMTTSVTSADPVPGRLTCICALGLLTIGSAPAAELIWHWDDRFSRGEQEKLKTWVEETARGIEEFIAPYPFDLHIHFHRASAAGEPVPWANTIRFHRQGVKIHVDPTSTAADLRADWTVYHELSHLLIPYLGRRHAWFAEGFASYMQYQVMHALGVLSAGQMQARYRERIDRAASRYDMPDTPFAEAAPTLRAKRRYRTMYWGGALFFLRVDRELRGQGETVPGIIRQFVECCRSTTRGLDSLVAELDRLADSDAFSRQLDTLRTEPGFPDDSGVWEDADVPAGR